MTKLHPQFIKDSSGENAMVVLSIKEYEAVLEELEDMEDVRLYDEAKRQDTGERISMEEAFKMIELNRTMA